MTPDTPNTTFNSQSPAWMSGPDVLPGPSHASSKTKPRRSTSSHPQENYPNTTASSLLCKKANDHIISLKRMLLQQQTVDSIHQTNLQALLWTKQTHRSEILKDDFKSTFNQAIYKWPLWTFFLNFTCKICRAYSAYFVIWIKTTAPTMAYSITLSLNYNFHDCVSIDTALLDVMYVEIEDRSSDINKHKHTRHNYTSRHVVSPQIK